MLLSITTTHQPASDLGYLLAKHPDRIQSFELNFGQAHFFYPEVRNDLCRACLLVELDPIYLTRRGQTVRDAGALYPYVNDRPYVASSFLCVALSQVLRSAIGGKCKERPDLAAQPIPLRAELSVVRCRGGEEFLRRLFEPLGYRVEAAPLPLDPHFEEWGPSPYFRVSVEAETTLAQLLTHLYVLLPVLDHDKHYWVGEDEVDKLIRHGEGWLETHPERNRITRGYLKQRPSLVRLALARLVEDEDEGSDDISRSKSTDEREAAVERPLGLHDTRLKTVALLLKEAGCRRVVDLGCGEGRLLRRLLEDRHFTEVVGLDASVRALEIAHSRLKLDELPEAQRQRIRLLHGALTYRDARIEGFDAAAVVEVIEHLDPPRLRAFERVLFGCAKPGLVLLTTPNREYNAKWPALGADELRHPDHRFEWTRAEFAAWAGEVAARHAYAVEIRPLGPSDPDVGAPSQLALFRKTAGAGTTAITESPHEN